MFASTSIAVPKGCYFVLLRGNRRRALFAADDDRCALNQIVGDIVERFKARLHAYCWMNNDLQLFMQIDEGSLGKIVHRITKEYSRHRRQGAKTGRNLFEARYIACPIEVNDDFLTLLRDIHLIPVIANRVVDPADYPWSSHRAYLGVDSIPWVSTEFGLSLFSSDLACARATYHYFIAQGVARNVDSETDTEPHYSIAAQGRAHAEINSLANR